MHRLLNLGLSKHVYLAEIETKKISGLQHRSVGYHHDASLSAPVFWAVLCVAATFR